MPRAPSIFWVIVRDWFVQCAPKHRSRRLATCHALRLNRFGGAVARGALSAAARLHLPLRRSVRQLYGTGLGQRMSLQGRLREFARQNSGRCQSATGRAEVVRQQYLALRSFGLLPAVMATTAWLQLGCVGPSTANGGNRCTGAAQLDAANGCKAVDYRSSRRLMTAQRFRESFGGTRRPFRLGRKV